MAAGPQAGTDGSDILGWSSLEGDVNHPDFSARTDQQGSREKSLKRMIKDMSQPVWGRWVEVFVRWVGKSPMDVFSPYRKELQANRYMCERIPQFQARW